MSNLRFGLLALVAFAMAFVGISWASKGFPVLTANSVAPRVEASVPAFDESVKPAAPKNQSARAAQSDEDKERDRLRLALMQASIGYKLSPCDAGMKKNLVTALTNYTSAWASMAGCRFDKCSGNDQQLDDAAAAFKTAADVGVHKELAAAFEQGGITRDDFPQSIRAWALMFSGLPFGDPNAAACTAGKRAENIGR